MMFIMVILLAVGVIAAVDEISIGEVDDSLLLRYFRVRNSNGSVSDLYINSGGLYLLPQYLPSDGTVRSICGFGYVNEKYEPLILGPNSQEIDPLTTTRPFSYVVLIRAVPENKNFYELVYPPAILAHGFSSNCIGLSEGLQWEAQVGDRIGVLIPSDCVMVDSIHEEVFVSQEVRNQFTQLCPSQVNLVANERESYGAYAGNSSSLSVDDLIDNVILSSDQFENITVHININITAIAERVSLTYLLNIVTPVSVASGLSLIGVILVVSMVSYCIAVKRKKSAHLKSSQLEDVYEEVDHYSRINLSPGVYNICHPKSVQPPIPPIPLSSFAPRNGNIPTSRNVCYEQVEKEERDTNFDDNIQTAHDECQENVYYKINGADNRNSEVESSPSHLPVPLHQNAANTVTLSSTMLDYNNAYNDPINFLS